jgi:hypothetical protein
MSDHRNQGTFKEMEWKALLTFPFATGASSSSRHVVELDNNSIASELDLSSVAYSSSKRPRRSESPEVATAKRTKKPRSGTGKKARAYDDNLNVFAQNDPLARELDISKAKDTGWMHDWFTYLLYQHLTENSSTKVLEQYPTGLSLSLGKKNCADCYILFSSK